MSSSQSATKSTTDQNAIMEARWVYHEADAPKSSPGARAGLRTLLQRPGALAIGRPPA